MSWTVVVGMGTRGFGIGFGGFLVGASLLGFRRCGTCGRYGQLAGTDAFASTLDALRASDGDADLDVSRFRPNLVADVDGPAFPETELVGRDLHV